MRSCKKYLLLLGLLLMAAVGGCGGIGYEETDENKPVTIKGPEGLPTNPKILIAYFSHTGNTELAAWQIQAAVGGQLFAIQTEVPYPQDKIIEMFADQIQSVSRVHSLLALSDSPSRK